MATDQAKTIYKARGARPSGSMRTPGPIARWAACCARPHQGPHVGPWIALAHNMIRTMEIVPHLMTSRAARPIRSKMRRMIATER